MKLYSKNMNNQEILIEKFFKSYKYNGAIHKN